MDFETLLKIVVGLISTRMGIILLGLMGNLVTLAVFSRKTFKRNSLIIYCRAMCIADCFTLVQFVYDVFLVGFHRNLILESNAACKLLFYLILCVPSISDWILAAFSISNMAKVSYSTVHSYLNKKTHKYVLIGLIFLLNILLYAQVFASLNIEVIVQSENGTSSVVVVCDINQPSTRYIEYIFVIESTLVPFGIMLVTTIVMAKSLHDSRKKVHVSLWNKRARKAKDFKFALSSILLNVTFVLLKLPLSVWFFANSQDYETNLISYLVTVILFYSNYSFRFVFHLIGNSIFRKEFCAMIGFTKNKQIPSASNNF